ncbi:IS21-like element helper ATPase IstB [bacterium]|nr:IS21-like element helper ATPase IstB [bacterium]
MNIHKKLQDHLKELRLPTIREHYEEAARSAENESLSYESFLMDLVEQERDERRRKRIERFQRLSCLPRDKTLDSFELDRLPLPVRHRVTSLLTGHFLDNAENVLAFGNPGSGKTHLLSAIGHELIFKNRKIFYTSCSFLVQNLLIAKRDLKLSKYLKKLSKFEAVIIDDIGYVQQSREEMEVLFTFLAERYERGSVMITSNLPFSKWEKIFKDPMTTAAAIDRLVHHSVILELNVSSYRFQKAQEKSGNSISAAKKVVTKTDSKAQNETPNMKRQDKDKP